MQSYSMWIFRFIFNAFFFLYILPPLYSNSLLNFEIPKVWRFLADLSLSLSLLHIAAPLKFVKPKRWTDLLY